MVNGWLIAVEKANVPVSWWSESDGSDARFVAPMEGTNHPLPSMGDSITWSPDSKSIAFVSGVPGPETEDATGDPVVITRYLYKPTAREGLTRFNDNKRLNIFVVGIEGRTVRQLTDATYYEHSIDWSPNGEEILFVSNREPDPDRFFNYDVFAIKVSDGSIRRITPPKISSTSPSGLPTASTIAYLGTRRGLTSSETTMEDTHVWLMDADGSNRRELGAAVDNRQRSHGWSPDGSAVYCTVQERGSQRLYRMPVSGAQPEPVGKPSSTGTVVTEMGGRGTSWSMGKGDLMAISSSSRKDMAQLYLLEKGKDEPKQLTDLNTGLAFQPGNCRGRERGLQQLRRNGGRGLSHPSSGPDRGLETPSHCRHQGRTSWSEWTSF